MNKIKEMVKLILSWDKNINVCDIVKTINKEINNETNHSKNNS